MTLTLGRLQQSIWYRLLKVVFIGSLLLAAIAVVEVANERPHTLLDRERTQVLCVRSRVIPDDEVIWDDDTPAPEKGLASALGLEGAAPPPTAQSKDHAGARRDGPTLADKYAKMDRGDGPTLADKYAKLADKYAKMDRGDGPTLADKYAKMDAQSNPFDGLGGTPVDDADDPFVGLDAQPVTDVALPGVRPFDCPFGGLRAGDRILSRRSLNAAEEVVAGAEWGAYDNFDASGCPDKDAVDRLQPICAASGGADGPGHVVIAAIQERGRGWGLVARAVFLGWAVLLSVFESVRRIFYYVILGTFRPKLEAIPR